jgi:hypothetical protein
VITHLNLMSRWNMSTGHLFTQENDSVNNNNNNNNNNSCVIASKACAYFEVWEADQYTTTHQSTARNLARLTLHSTPPIYSTVLLLAITKTVRLMTVKVFEIKLFEFAYCSSLSTLVCTTWWWPPCWPKHVVVASYPPSLAVIYQVCSCVYDCFHTHFIACVYLCVGLRILLKQIT